ncbi:MAG: amidohydrolase family protein [Bacillota bacterium]
MNSILLINIGQIATGILNKPLATANCIGIRDGVIERIGRQESFDPHRYQVTIDVNGQTAVPGFIDAHVHNGMEDYNACLQMAGLLESAMQNGTTTLISEGEQGPGYPRFYADKEGTKAQCVFAHRLFSNYRPGNGLKLHAGALVLCDDLEETDFAELSSKGVRLIGEIGGGGSSDMGKIRRMVKWARKYGFFISVHLAPPSIPGSTWLRAQDVISLEPDKIAHANGGTTSCCWEEIKEVIDHTTGGIEVIPEGNCVNYNRILRYLREIGQEHRLVFGSDAPTGACNLAGAINKAIVRASSLNGIPAQNAIAYATGNTAKLYGLNTGRIEVGKEADIVIIDAPPGSAGNDAFGAIEAGDLFGCSLVVVDGKVVALRGRDTRATARVCRYAGKDLYPKDVHEFLYQPITEFVF